MERTGNKHSLCYRTGILANLVVPRDVVLLTALWTIYILRLRHVTTLLHLRHQERLSEREDIARDLHDTFFQAVQSLFLRLHTASRNLPEHIPVRQALEEVLNDSDRVMSEGREMFLDVPQEGVRRARLRAIDCRLLR